jgi:hypothetical protein
VSKSPDLGPSTVISRRHARVGWWSLLAFVGLGIVLESLHGLKLGFYLDVSNEARRLLWTLAHAHGTLLSLINLVFALTLPTIPAWPERSLHLASRCLLAGLVLMPVGFFLGGCFIHDGDPGLGVLLVPPGALLVFAAIFLTARAVSRSEGAP